MTASPEREDIAALLTRARGHAAIGEDALAQAAYLALLRRDPTNLAALNELGSLAHAGGYRSAARTAYEQLVRCHPQNPAGRVNLGTMLHEDGDAIAARRQFEAALAADAACAEARRGLARILEEQGDAQGADRHWRQSFSGQAIAPQLYRGAAPAKPLLLLVSAKGGNIPTRSFLDDRIFAVTALYAEYHDPALPLPPHALVFNAIGDADLCVRALLCAQEIVARTDAPVVNAPARVRQTGRAANAARLANIAHVRTPGTVTVARNDLRQIEALSFPLLLRAPGFHTGQHFVKVASPDDLAAAAASLPGEDLLAIEYLDARGADGLARKYRIMAIDGAIYPIHLAICADWKVHYFTADMAQSPAHRTEEQHFLEDMKSVLGDRAIAALTGIAGSLGLDYAGMDFALGANGDVLLFEANATMVLHPPARDPMWDYRRAPIAAALKAAAQMLTRRLTP